MRNNKSPQPSIQPIVKADPAAINARRRDGHHIEQRHYSKAQEAHNGHEWRKQHILSAK